MLLDSVALNEGKSEEIQLPFRPGKRTAPELREIEE
jgi:hypothetical protein